VELRCVVGGPSIRSGGISGRSRSDLSRGTPRVPEMLADLNFACLSPCFAMCGCYKRRRKVATSF
jgi:hypothetical protein